MLKLWYKKEDVWSSSLDLASYDDFEEVGAKREQGEDLDGYTYSNTLNIKKYWDITISADETYLAATRSFLINLLIADAWKIQLDGWASPIEVVLLLNGKVKMKYIKNMKNLPEIVLPFVNKNKNDI
jgi:hypothetical protein